jgi:hypothetical protein
MNRRFEQDLAIGSLLSVTNRLPFASSIQRYGTLLLYQMDGVTKISFKANASSDNLSGLFEHGDRGQLRFINGISRWFTVFEFPVLNSPLFRSMTRMWRR